MSDDLEQALDAPQPGESVPESQPENRRNLYDSPEFRAWQSTMERNLNETRRELESERRRREAAEAKAQAIEETLTYVDEDDREVLYARYRQGEIEAENRMLRQRFEQEERQAEEEANYRAHHEQMARDMGLDPLHPQYQSAIELSMRQPNPHAYMEGFRTLMRNPGKQPNTDALEQRKQELEARARAGHYTTGPGGGQRAPGRLPLSDDEHADYQQALLNPSLSGNREKIERYRKRLHENPDQ